MTWATVVLAAATVGSDYQSGVVSGGALMGCAAGIPYHRVIDGRVPEGLDLQPAGDFRGRPLHAGEYSLLVEASNGCSKVVVPVRLSVKGRPFLAVFDTEVELTAQKPAAVRIFGDRPALAYTVETSVPWLKARPLLGRTPTDGEALAADLLTLEVDSQALDKAELPAAQEAHAEVRLSCFRCKGIVLTVSVKRPSSE